MSSQSGLQSATTTTKSPSRGRSQPSEHPKAATPLKRPRDNEDTAAILDSATDRDVAKTSADPQADATANPPLQAQYTSQAPELMEEAVSQSLLDAASRKDTTSSSSPNNSPNTANSSTPAAVVASPANDEASKGQDAQQSEETKADVPVPAELAGPMEEAVGLPLIAAAAQQDKDNESAHSQSPVKAQDKATPATTADEAPPQESDGDESTPTNTTAQQQEEEGSDLPIPPPVNTTAVFEDDSVPLPAPVESKEEEGEPLAAVASHGDDISPTKTEAVKEAADTETVVAASDHAPCSLEANATATTTSTTTTTTTLVKHTTTSVTASPLQKAGGTEDDLCGPVNSGTPIATETTVTAETTMTKITTSVIATPTVRPPLSECDLNQSSLNLLSKPSRSASLPPVTGTLDSIPEAPMNQQE